MAAQHTPGPWQIEGKFQEIGSSDWGFIITAGTNEQHDGPAAHVGDLMVSEGDAHLIAAAPTLLLTVKLLLQHMVFDPEGDLNGPEWDEMTARAQRIVDQAEGR